MKINFVQNNVKFGSIPLYRATIRQRLFDCKEDTPADVFISKLEHSDIPKLKKDEKEWMDTRYGELLMEAMESINPDVIRFLENFSTIYAVEVPLSYGQKQIRAMAEVMNEGNIKKLERIQVNNVACMPSYLKGAGSCLLYAIINDAQKEKRSEFYLYSNSAAMGFYKKNGLKQPNKNDSKFVLPQKMFDKRLSKLEKKYSIQKINYGENK